MNVLIEILPGRTPLALSASKMLSSKGGWPPRLAGRTTVSLLCLGWMILGQNAWAGSVPAITTQPASQVVAAGGTVNLSVAATGEAPLGFQWFKNGGTVPGATDSSLTLADATVANSGVYYVVVTNAAGLAISLPAAVEAGTPQLLAWGDNEYGQLDDGSTSRAYSPEPVASSIVAGAAGNMHSLYLKGDGTLWAMGYNGYGQLGDGTTSNRSSAVVVASNVVAVAAGADHSLFLKTDGTMWGMGYNWDGELGDGMPTQRNSPEPLETNVVALAPGEWHSLFLKSDGTLWATGQNSFGQLGDGTTSGRTVPESVASNVVGAVAAAMQSVFFKGDGTLWAMGYNYYGELGDGTTTQRNSPVPVPGRALAGVFSGCVSAHTLAVGMSPPPLITAQPASQAVGPLDTATLSVTASGRTPFSYQWLKDGRIIAGATRSTLNLPGTGATNSGVYYVVVTNEDGLSISQPARVAAGSPELLAWGNNSNGQLGDGTTTTALWPEVVDSNVVVAAAGGSHSLYLKSDGTLWGMGYNGDGELGDGTTIQRTRPESVASNVVAVAAGQSHSLFLRSDGTLWAMGNSADGQLGDGSSGSQLVPQSVASNVVAMAAGANHSLFLKNDGTLWAMGYNYDGELGDGTTTYRYSPVAVLSGTNVVAVAAGAGHSLFLRSDGTLWGMGYNDNGELGDGTGINRSSPVAVLGGANAVAAAGGANHSLFLKGDGTLWAMGFNGDGELGDGTSTGRTTPESVATNGAAVTAGWYSSLFAKGDGTLWAMGYNSQGGLGNGTTAQEDSPVLLGGISAATVSSCSHGFHALAVGLTLPPEIAGQPTNQTVAAGDTATFSVTAGGFGPLSYQWHLDGTNVANATNATLTIAGVAVSDAGTYAVSVNSAVGSIISSAAVLVVNKTVPAVTRWPTAAAITYGQTLASSMLTGGAASVAGSFAFTAPGTAPAAGTASQSVTFTPNDTTNYTTVAGSVSVTVNPATTTVTTWPSAAAITYGQSLASSTLTGGAASVAGSFAFTTPSTALAAGTASQSVTFTPADTTDYMPAIGSVSVTVNIATPTVTTWPTATAITYGQTLASSALTGGAASVGGSFAFTTPGTAPAAGTSSQPVAFTPTDTTDYTTLAGSVSVIVNAATATVTLGNLSQTYDGTPKAATATTSPTNLLVTLTYNGLAAAPTNAGSYTVIGTVSDANYQGSATNLLVIGQAATTVTTWPTATAITNGQTLASSTLIGGAASVDGSFAFTSPTAVAPAGTSLQPVAFTPGDATDYMTVTGSVSVSVVSPPAITTQPTNQMLAEGGTVTLSVTASGDAPVGWQWFKNGGMVLGANDSTLSIADAGMTNSGVYYALVTNAYGLRLSQPVTVEIGVPQLLDWGENDYGQLGDGTQANRSSPKPVGSNVVATAAGADHSLFVTADGTLWAMGYNGDGELGDGTTTSKSWPEPVASNVVAVAAGAWHSLFLKSDSTLWGMGANYNGQLGNGTANQQVNPIPIATNVVAVAAGWYHSLYLTSDGTLWAMGYNAEGELGDGTTTYAYAPEAVASNVVAAGAGAWHSLFLKSDGALWAMGQNTSGQLGDGTTLDAYWPEAVASNAVAMAAGYSHTLYLTSDGTLWGMGANYNGQLGAATNTDVYWPQAVAANVMAVAAGYNDSLYLANNGTLWGMGANSVGQLGDGTNNASSAPVTVPGMSLATVVSGCCANHSLALGLPLPPVITSQPASQTVMAGTPVSFSVAVCAVGPLAYQWEFNGTNLLSATNASYALASAALSDAGSYAVVVTGTYGTTVSTTATLTVTNPPPVMATVTVTANPTNAGTLTGGGVYVAGSNAVLTATATNGWQFIGWSDGATDNPYVITVPATNCTYTANFAAAATITVDASPIAGGSVIGGGTFLVGGTNVITALASNGWVFVGWSDDTTNNPYAITVPATNCSFTASFVAVATITLAANPIAGGSVIGGGTFPVGSTNLITALASNNWVFTGWSDGTTSNPYAILVSSNRTYTANFASAATVTTIASPPEGGSTAGGGAYAIGALATLTATASNGWVFLNWNGTITNYLQTGNTNNPLVFKVTTNITCTANFAPVTNGFVYTMVEVAGTPNAEILGYTGSPSDTVVVPSVIAGAAVTIIGPGAFWLWKYAKVVVPGSVGEIKSGAICAETVEFTAEGAAAAGEAALPVLEAGAIAGVGDIIVDYVVPAAALTAMLADLIDILSTLETVETVASPDNGGDCSGSGIYTAGTPAELSAKPNDGWVFTSWNDGITNRVRTITVPEHSATYTASFIQLSTVTVLANPTNGGTVTGGGTYQVGTQVSLTALPNEDQTSGTEWVFTGWNDGSTNNPYVITVPDHDVTYIASFEEEVEIEAEAEPRDGGIATGSGTYPVGKEVWLTATPFSGWRFDGWFWEGSNTNLPVIPVWAYPMPQPLKYKAQFVQVFTLNAFANPTNAGSVAGGGQYDVDVTNVTLTATASNNWMFVNWSDGTTTNPYTVIIPPQTITNILMIYNYTANFTATTPPYITNSLSGTNLTLSWAADHMGWILQAQTNSSGAGLSTYWFDMPGTSDTNAAAFPISPADRPVFYRLRLP